MGEDGSQRTHLLMDNVHEQKVEAAFSAPDLVVSGVSSAVMNKASRPGSWSPAHSTALYRIDAWGQGYFAVSPDGRLIVRSNGEGEEGIDLLEVVEVGCYFGPDTSREVPTLQS